jgi:hypothetical protein
MPRENGIHNIHVKFNGVHIPGSPLRIKVGKEDADPAAVHAHGNGLGDVKTGEWTVAIRRHICFIYFDIFDYNKLRTVPLRAVAKCTLITAAAEGVHLVQIKELLSIM